MLLSPFCESYPFWRVSMTARGIRLIGVTTVVLLLAGLTEGTGSAAPRPAPTAQSATTIVS